jgi:hypothetical protein
MRSVGLRTNHSSVRWSSRRKNRHWENLWDIASVLDSDNQFSTTTRPGPDTRLCRSTSLASRSGRG